jgi:TP901 family phage tail tape measure protein
LKLSIGGLADAETTTLALTKAMAIYEDQLKGPTDAADILFRGVELGQTRMEDLAASIPQVLGPAKALGLSFDEITGAVASFSKRAGSTSIAVTQLQSIFTGVLKGQERAGPVLGKNAELFSVQALASKGLAKFLKDLNVALGGNEVALNKLFGRKEAISGFLAAASDGFGDLKTVIDATSGPDTLGAAERAFQRVSQSIGGQIDILKARAANFVLSFGIQGEDAITSILKSINDGLLTLSKNAEKIVIKLKALLISVGIVAFSQFSIRAIAALKRIQLSFIQFRATAATSLTGVRVGLLGFIKTLTLAKISVKSFKAVLTFGVTIVLDVIIEKLLLLEDELGGFGNVLNFFKIKAQIAFKNVELFAEKLIVKLQELRIKGVEFLNAGIQKMGALIGLNVKPSGIENLTSALNKSKMAIAETTGELAKLQKQLDKKKKPEDPTGGLGGTAADTGGPVNIPGVPDPNKVNQQLQTIRENVVNFNAEMMQIKAQQQALDEETKIQLQIAQGEATEADFERLRQIELEKINIAFEAEKQKTQLIADEQKRALELKKIDAKRTLTLEKTKAKQEITVARQKAALKLKTEQQNVQMIAAVGNLGAALAKDGSKAQFLIQKASAIASSIVATKLAVAQALATPPGPPTSTGLAAKVGLIGKINTAAILATAIKGFRTGGIVGGTPTGGRDSVLARVEPREMMLTRAQQGRLFQLANGAEPEGKSAMAEALNNLANAMMNQQTSIEIDGRQVALAVRDQRLAGVAI